ncbi:NifX-associated nitrogen fixation protein [Methylomonas sp. AM2-LC]|uniref:NifX-associated nitrogen fixation protein n=1 Tax=Methylomonas sp. AM2-LC TaxID=3153301 RepID=UPI00326371B4
MTQAALAVEIGNPLMSSDVVLAMLKQLRAIDTYDSYEGWSEEKIIDPIILTKERKREIPIVGDPDEITLARVKAYYNSIATLVEKQSGLLAVPVINISHEGFGRAFVLVGKLIVVDKILRDVHRWGFPSLEDMVEKTEQTISKAVSLIEQYREVAEA